MWDTKGNLNALIAFADLYSFPLTTWWRASVHAAKAERMTRWATLHSARASKVCIANKHSNSRQWVKWMLDWGELNCSRPLERRTDAARLAHTVMGGWKWKPGRGICYKPTSPSPGSCHAVGISPRRSFWGSFSCFCEKQELLYRPV